MKKRILFVDDEKRSREIFRELLEEFGYEVITGDSESEAYKMISQGLKYDLAIIDWTLDYANPYAGASIMELSKRTNPKVPVISFSGWSGKPKEADYNYLKGKDNSKFENLQELIESCIGK